MSESPAQLASEKKVKRRCVIYFSGFDPSGPRRYHELYRQEAALASPLLKASIDVSSREQEASSNTTNWKVSFNGSDETESYQVKTDYVMARWDDLVRQHWLRTDQLAALLQFAWKFFKAQVYFWSSGTAWRCNKLAWPPCLSFTIPPLIFGLVLGLSVLMGAISSGMSIFQEYRPITGIKITHIAIFYIAFSLAIIFSIWRLEKRWHMLWLMRIWIFTLAQGQRQLPEVEQRIQIWAQYIADQSLRDEYDEILIVGHSLGSMMAGQALAQALDFSQCRTERLALLTLGQCWPMLSCQPGAIKTHQAVQKLSSQENLTWVEITAAADGSCFAFVDPTMTLPSGSCISHRPQMISPRWHTLFTPDQYLAIKKDQFRFHFQYLYATPTLGLCDYFAITAGPQTLRERFSQVPSAV